MSRSKQGKSTRHTNKKDEMESPRKAHQQTHLWAKGHREEDQHFEGFFFSSAIDRMDLLYLGLSTD